jgi:hypothetical protein
LRTGKTAESTIDATDALYDENGIALDAPPDLPSGSSLLDVSVDDGAKTLSWSTFAINLPGPILCVKVGKINPADSNRIRKFQIPVEVDLGVAPEAEGATKTGEVANVWLEDVLGRKLWQKSIPASPDNRHIAVEISVERSDLLRQTAFLHVALQSQTSRVSESVTRVIFPKEVDPRYDDYNVSAYVWTSPDYRKMVFPLLREMGVNTINCWPGGALQAMQGGFFWTDAWGGFGNYQEDLTSPLQERKSPIKGDADRHLRDGMFYAPSWSKGVDQFLLEYASRVKDHPPLGRMLVDEMTLAAPWSGHGDPRAEPDRSPLALKLYREFLQKKYVNVSKLNAKWKTRYSDWSEIMPPLTPEARSQGVFAPWIEFRIFMETLFAETGADFVSLVNKHMPGVAAGQPNWTWETPFSGIDPAKIISVRTGGLDYGNMDFVNSYKKTGSPIWNWYGQGALPDAPAIRQEFYSRLFQGGTGITLYGMEWGDPKSPDGFLHPSIAGTSRSENIGRVLRELVNGAGRLVMDTPKTPPTVAIIHSQASMHMAWLESTDDISFSWTIRERPVVDSYMSWFRSRFGMTTLLHQCGFTYQWITESEIDPATLERYSVVALPMTIGLSEKSRTALLRWMEGGGVLIADTNSATRDELGNPTGDGWIQSTFGATLSDPVDYSKHQVRMPSGTFELGGRRPLSTKAEELVSYALVEKLVGILGIANTSTKTDVVISYADGVPLLVSSQKKKGRSILINGVCNYSRTLRNSVSSILLKQGVKPKVDVVSMDGKESLDGYEIYGFRKSEDGLSLCGVLRNDNPGAERNLGLPGEKSTPKTAAKLVLDKSKRVFDIREGKDLGVTDQLPIGMEKKDAAVFAFFPPERVPEIQVTVKAIANQSGINQTSAFVTLEPDSRKDIRILSIEFLDRDSKEIQELHYNVKADEQPTPVAITFDVGNSYGVASVRIRDVATGLSKTIPLQQSSK